MGLSASQARFLQLTARRSNIEYEAQQISQHRLQLADKLEMASTEYQNKTSNRKMVFRFNDGNQINNIDVTYQNYKSYMNQQLEGINTVHQKYYLVSSSGNKIVVANAEERDKMIAGVSAPKDKNGEYREKVLTAEDFIIADNLEDVDAFQLSVQNGDYYFATMNEIEFDDNNNPVVTFNTESWDTLGGGVISEEYDKTDDAEAEAKFKTEQTKIQKQDKMLELRLTQLESERNAIQTEIDSVSKVIGDNIDQTFKTFS